MDISLLAQSVAALLTPYLPYLVKPGAKALEEINMKVGGDTHNLSLEVNEMRYTIRGIIALLALLLAAPLVTAQNSVLTLKVMNLKGQPMRGIKLDLEEPGCVPISPSDDKGIAKIKLAPALKLQAWVTLVLSRIVYALIQPYDRRAPRQFAGSRHGNFKGAVSLRHESIYE